MKRVVSNTGPVLHLQESQCLSLLEQAGEIYIPEAVDMEMRQLDLNWYDHKPDWLVVQVVSEPYSTQAIRWEQAGLLHRGEVEAVALAQELNADWFLTDDSAARVFATALGLEVHGTLGVILWAAAVGHLSYDEAKSALNRLVQSSLWMSLRILAEAHAALNQLFS